MSIKSVLSAVIVSTLIVPAVLAATVPANYAAGVVTAIDATAGTLTVDGTTFAAKPNFLGEISMGNEVDVAYVTVNGMKQAISIELTGTEETVDLVD
jgi:hypothetical protein